MSEAVKKPRKKKQPQTEQLEFQHKGKVREGIVLSNKMNKTIVVEVTRLIQHAQFKKTVRSKIRYMAHDERNVAKEGDKVRIAETRALSRNKRWTLIKVLS